MSQEAQADIPTFLYRFMNEESHVEALLAGDVWISTLECCRRAEAPPRGDPLEGFTGYASGEVSGDMSDPEVRAVASHLPFPLDDNAEAITISRFSALTWVMDAWVLCMTERPDPEPMAGFGRFCVRIDHPELFFLATSLGLRTKATYATARLDKVVYNSLWHQGMEDPPGREGFVKRPDPYEAQQEWRILWMPPFPRGPLKHGILSCPEVIPFLTRIR